MFADDPLRMMRLIRFQAKYGWKVPKSVLKTIKRNAKRIKIISEERVHDELVKIMELGKLKQAIRIMDITGLLHYILPEIEALKGVIQPEKYHAEGDVYKHTLKVLENAKPGIENQMAALLHDTGKKSTQSILKDEIHFYGHEDVSTEIARAVMNRLKFDKKTTDNVIKIVKNHMVTIHLLKAKEKTLRKFIRKIGDEMVDALLDMAKADELGSLPNKNLIPDLAGRIEEIRKAPVKIKKTPILNGKEIMELLDLEPGPEVGKAKEYLLDKQDEYASKEKKLTKGEAKEILLKKYKQ